MCFWPVLCFVCLWGFPRSRCFYVYGFLDWFSIRVSCFVVVSLIGDHIQVAIFLGYFVGYCLCISCLCQHQCL